MTSTYWESWGSNAHIETGSAAMLVVDPHLVRNGGGMAALGHFADHTLLSHKRHDEPAQLTIAELAGALAGGAGIVEVLTTLTFAS